jgi:ABC-type nitrate/sulfonate/bicarbonate transport system ATPase subunit
MTGEAARDERMTDRMSAGDTPRIELQGVSKTFTGDSRRVSAVENLSFEVYGGEFVTILGPSGSGKSTIFNMIAGLLEPDTGQICIDGEICENRIGRVGYMPQKDLLFPWRSVLENVIVAQDIHGTERSISSEKARDLLPLFGLEEFAETYPAALSGGMRQRAALLRTILTEREVLLLDEPFGALDALTRRDLQDWLLDLWGRFGQTMAFITHDVQEALYLGDRVIVLSARPGRVVKELRVDLPRPRRQGMITLPQFSRQASELLEAIGVEI